jgi:hypothetical protein
MNTKLWCFAAALLPLCCLSAQQPAPQAPPQANRTGFQQPSSEVLREATELRQRDRAHAIAINDVAGRIRTLDDARQLVDLVAAEFSDELPARWATQSIRGRIARAEFKSAVAPGALIPEQHIADAWNDFVKKIGAPQETTLTAADVHYLRDAQYVDARISWINYEKDIWTIPGIFAVGPDGKIAQGSRTLEAIRLLWLLGNNEDDFSGIHAAAQKGVLLSDLLQHPPKPGSGQAQGGFAVARMVSFPVQQAAFRYQRNHGARALNRAIEDLLKSLING